MNIRKQYTIGTVLSYTSIAFNIISGLLYTPWMIRSIGKSHYALYSLATSIVSIFLIDFGLGAATSKYLSNYYAERKIDEANRFITLIYKIFIFLSFIFFIVFLVFYFFIDNVYTKLSSDEIEIFKNIYIIVSIYSVISFPCMAFNGILIANEQFIAVKFCNLCQKIFNVILIIFLLLCKKGVYSLVIAHAFSSIFFNLLKLFFIKKYTKVNIIWNSWDKRLVKNLFMFSFWITVMSLAQRCIFNIMPSIIAKAIGSYSVAYFAIAASIEGYIYVFSDAINGMFLPRISRIFTHDNVSQELNDLMCVVGKYHIYTLGLIFACFLCLGKQFITLWMGEGYENVYFCAIIIISPSLISAPQQVANTSLIVRDYIRENAIVYIIASIINIIIALIAIPIIGIKGASISILISYLIRIILMNFLIKKYLPIKILKFYFIVYGKWIICFILIILIGYYINIIFISNGWLGLFIKASIIAIVYISLLWNIDLDEKNKKYVVNIIFNKIASINK